ncbi:aldehyde dehydrogenase family protein [Pseudomonas sp. B2M1-30]|uniref:acyl-CoA reductase n=1 Tax=Pseudomonas TaxID=286 RepID=UPI0021C88729|nr:MULTISPECIES: acyl-CoA reductase [Pseudomonas]MCU0121883.1 aldehyde dehydrogenase family protein [Pseudomonas sp. B2M1-30]MCU7264004.1 aldehyde dehydrogenase family protein [Pseudomonas koreensis]
MYLINGQLHADYHLDDALQQLHRQLPEQLNTALDSATVIDAVSAFARRLRSGEPALNDEQRQALIDFCEPEALRRKLERELGQQADSLRRIDYRQARFERWSPLGLVVHITPGNSPLLAFCAVIESLLAGNINWLRPSASDLGLTARLLHALVQCDPGGRLRGHVAVLPTTTAQIGQLCQWANGVSAWGGESALRAIRQQLPAGCRWIDWGHRISFIYLTPDSATPASLDAVVDEVCRLDQQACSSPQWLLVDSDDPGVLREIGANLAEAFTRRAGQWPALAPSIQEACEVTTHTRMAHLAQSFSAQNGQIWSAPGWRVIWSHDPQLGPSPLFRSLLLKPMPRTSLSTALLPWRNVLQSCALICAEREITGLSRTLVAAGVTRIAPIEAIHDGYDGEPHDGVYALQRLSRRVSVSLPATVLATHATLDAQPSNPVPRDLPIMSKDTFTARPIHPAAQLYFRSGGSSGTPALSGFSYHDFRSQMRATADALFAAGLEPQRDRVMNLFFSGGLYGGFFSFSKVLELLDVTHLPMGAPADDDYAEIAQLIVEQRVSVLIGMPSTLHRLFLDQQQTLRDYGGIEKVFLGGEHLNEQSRELMQSCGVSSIRSAIYGSVDAGPLGHACKATRDGVFHLMSDIQQLEIVAFDRDEPVQGNEVGRLLFTSTARQGQDVLRYDIGDSGRWLAGPCPCGLESPRFELLQRHGRLVRIGTDFICLSELAQHLQTPFQVILEHAPDGLERLRFRSACEPREIRQRLLNYPTLTTLVQTGLLRVEVEVCAPQQFTRNKHSGKTPLLIDSRR